MHHRPSCPSLLSASEAALALVAMCATRLASRNSRTRWNAADSTRRCVQKVSRPSDSKLSWNLALMLSRIRLIEATIFQARRGSDEGGLAETLAK
ncbi:hypothetical protein Q1695_011602 [Nippostrongylus brasiliensis]|nr:hypothetical protein Q1695_011602 [Nippostrongylus brasiliensis]